MSFLMLCGFGAVVAFTSVVSGVFGMAGGVILIGVLLATMPVPAAMALHGATQISANLSRAVMWRRHMRWRTVVPYVGGIVAAVGVSAAVLYVPPPAVSYLLLGTVPFAVRLIPDALQGRPERAFDSAVYGFVCMTAILITGVAGPMLDAFFLRGAFDRREIVATKAACQTFGHAGKILYFGALVDASVLADPAALGVAVVTAIAGTSLGGLVLARMHDASFRRWADRIVNTLCAGYACYGAYLLVFAKGA